MSKENFDKFINKKVTGAKKKEELKQKKRVDKKEREAYFIEKKRQIRAAKKMQEERRAQQTAGTDSRNKYPKDDTKTPPKNIKAAANKNTTPGKQVGRPKSANKRAATVENKREAKPYQKSEAVTPNAAPIRIDKPVVKTAKATSSYKENKAAFERKVAAKNQGEEIPKEKIAAKKTVAPAPQKKISIDVEDAEASMPIVNLSKKKEGDRDKKDLNPRFEKRADRQPNDPGLPYARKRVQPIAADATPKADKPKRPSIINKASNIDMASGMPLNKFIAHGGICSRRDAGELVKSGKVQVNGVVITEPGYKVQENDTIFANGKKVTNQHNLVYILLNKPKDYITTAEDPQGRKTVLDIVKGATDERIYPVGRLDRNTSGVLLLTNDGELAQQLTHPSYEVRKIYEAKLDKPLAKADFDKLLEGIVLEDGTVKADSVAYADSKDRSVIGIEIHSGRNRVVRRMFESLGYDVKALDRVMFATLTKKNVDRGTWRFLAEKEVRLLKFFNKSKR